MKIALIIGVSGQDGSYLAELLIAKKYIVHGIVKDKISIDRMSQYYNFSIINKINIHIVDITKNNYIEELVINIKPDEIYHLATNHEVGFNENEYNKASLINVDSLRIILNTIKNNNMTSKIFYASTSKIFGVPCSHSQNENTKYNPVSYYGLTKVTGMNLINIFRRNFNIFACSGILYNHESPRRDLNFLPRKITSSAVRIKLGYEKKLILGNIDAKHDWGYAGDYVNAMWLTLQCDQPNDFIIGTGNIYSIEWILEFVFGQLGLDWTKYVIYNNIINNNKYQLKADISSINEKTGWKPSTNFSDVLKIMIENEFIINS